MTRRSNRPGSAPQLRRRVLLASLAAIPLALVSGAQAFSSAAVRRAPEAALAVFPWNGLAAEEATFRRLAAEAKPSAAPPATASPAIGVPSGASADLARDAIRREPLATRAYIVLALAEADSARRGKILATTGRLTRRDQALQTLLLEQYGKAGDYPRMIEALDANLRVHPEWRDVVFPALARTLSEEPAVVPTMARLLARPLPWREGFLNAAVVAPHAPDNLAALRERIALDDPEFDRRLIARLAGDGRFVPAEQLYAKVAGANRAAAGEGWRAAFPPFDWQLADQPGFRAQSGDRPGTLEIVAAAGNGGIIAAQVRRNPGAPFTLSLTSEVDPQSQIDDLHLRVACGGASGVAGEPFFDRPFTKGANVFSVDPPSGCPFLALTITARAWTGKPPLRATLSSMVTGLPSRPR